LFHKQIIYNFMMKIIIKLIIVLIKILNIIINHFHQNMKIISIVIKIINNKLFKKQDKVKNNLK
jgi:hypothetical protein